MAIYCDLNKIEGNSLLKLRTETARILRARGCRQALFDSVVISHVFNYIDYKMFLMVIREFLKKDGLIFINNVVDYGLPEFFSNKRPKSINDTLQTLNRTGYKMIEKK